MPFVPGFPLRPCELVAPIGAGGMGEVWRSRDPRLGREEEALAGRRPWVRDPAAVWRIDPVVVGADDRHYACSATRNQSDLYVYTGLR